MLQQCTFWLACAYWHSIYNLFPSRKIPPGYSAEILTKGIQLFGHEIVAILCGLVWGLWVGFAIVAAGTFLGEVGNF